jgi:heme o synthase
MSSSIATSVSQPRQALEPSPAVSPLAAMLTRIAPYLELAKPRIALMVLISMAVGYVLGSRGVWQPVPFLHACIGIVLAVVSSSALNQYLERETDARMKRTQSRPLPTHRLTGLEVLLFGSACGFGSFVYLYLTVNVLTAWLTLATVVMYAGLYTPLKRSTAFCTVIGAVPGAIPPVLGWTAAGAELSLPAFSLFAILFVWQFPHFLAIAWMYRDQYTGAGLRMVPGGGRLGIVGAIAAGYALVLIPVSLLPRHLGYAGDLYAVSAVVLGVMYAVVSVRFQRHESRENARSVLLCSLAYLPLLLMTLTIDHLRLIH